MKKLLVSAFALFFSLGAKGQIIYTDILPDTILNLKEDPNNPFPGLVQHFGIAGIDFDDDGIEEYNFRSDYSEGGGPWYLHLLRGITTGSEDQEVVTTGSDVEPIISGSSISDAVNWSPSSDSPFLAYYLNTNFQNLGDRYIGCRFTLGTNIHYGWIRVSLDNDLIFSVKDYAYESSPNTPIIAGEQSSPTILVTSIGVQGESGETTITEKGGTLQMTDMVLPENATDKTITWSVTDMTGSATISSTGLLTAASDGMVRVTATANDGSGVEGSVEITIANQTVGISELENSEISIFPLPSEDYINILSKNKVTSVSVFSITGEMIFSTSKSKVDIRTLETGSYYLLLSTENGRVHTRRFIKSN